MYIEINAKFLDELQHTAMKLHHAQKYIKETMIPEQVASIDNDIRTAYVLLEAIVDGAKHGVDAKGCVIKRENEEDGAMHTHMVLTCFCISNEWLGEQGDS